jgi:hypothetical protein
MCGRRATPDGSRAPKVAAARLRGRAARGRPDPIANGACRSIGGPRYDLISSGIGTCGWTSVYRHRLFWRRLPALSSFLGHRPAHAPPTYRCDRRRHRSARSGGRRPCRTLSHRDRDPELHPRHQRSQHRGPRAAIFRPNSDAPSWPPAPGSPGLRALSNRHRNS